LTGPASGTRRAILLRRPGTLRRGQDMATDGERRRLASLFSRARARAWIMDNKLFALVLIPALLLRVDAELGYEWQAWFNDSFQYMSDVIGLHPDVTRPVGYSIFLKVLEPLHSYAAVTILQHLMGVAVGVMVYAVARHRFGTPRWIATLATLPVLFDGFQIQLEHLILSDVPFEFLIALAVTLLLWDRKPSWQRCTLIGFILGIAETVRSVALPLLLIFAVYIVLRRIGWRAVVGALVACLTPVLLYCTWFYSVYGQFAMTESTGVFLYSRTMAFANCSKMHVPTDELSLCTTTPPDQRPMSQSYIWANFTPLNRFPPSKFSPLPNQLAEDFAKRAILAQPLGYAQIVGYDTIRVFEWRRYVFPNAATYDEYLFGYKSLAIPDWARGHVGSYDSDVAYYIRGNPLTDVVEPFAGVMRVWQRYIWLPGSVYGAILAVGLTGMVLKWRRLGGPATVPWLISVGLIMAPAMTAEFDYRYVLPAVPFACLAAAMAFGKDTTMGNWVAARQAARQERKGDAVTVSPAPAITQGQELTEGETTAS
jgi:Dolichyl-phosphate-mannose-protein mannosyltransferase